MDSIKFNPFQAGSVNPQNMGVNQGVTPPSTQPVSVFQGGTSGIPKEAHDKFAQGGLTSFDVSKYNPFQPESRTAEQGQNLYMLV